MNFGELQTALSNRLGLPAAGDALLTATSQASLVNEALTVISTERMWWWLLTDYTFQFNAGVATLPTDLIKIEAVQAYGGLLEPVSRRDLVDADYVELPSPVGWTTVGNQIRLAPAPSGLVDGRLYYYRTEPTLVNATDTPLMPVAFHGAIVAYGAYLAHTRRQDPVRAQAATLEYQAWLKRTVDEQSPVKGPRRVRVGRQTTAVTSPSSTLPAQASLTVGGVIVCTSSTRPTGVNGQLIMETDTDRLLEYDSTAVAWVPPRGIGYVSASGSPPTSPYDGMLWFRTDLRDLVSRNAAGSSWVAVAGSGVPIYTSGTRPAGVDGQVIFETDTRRLMVYATALGWQSPAGLVYICTSATRPSLQYDGQTIFETDTRRLMTYQAGITSWVPTPGTVLICTSATRPAAVQGRGIYETDTNKLLIYTTATTQWQPPWNVAWGLLGYVQIVVNASFTSITDIAGLSVAVTHVANRRVRFRAFCPRISNNTTASMAAWLYVRDSLGNQVAGGYVNEGVIHSSGGGTFGLAEAITSPAAGATTWKVVAERNSGTDTHTFNSSSISPSFLSIEDLGPNGAPA